MICPKCYNDDDKEVEMEKIKSESENWNYEFEILEHWIDEYWECPRCGHIDSIDESEDSDQQYENWYANNFL